MYIPKETVSHPPYIISKNIRNKKLKFQKNIYFVRGSINLNLINL